MKKMACGFFFLVGGGFITASTLGAYGRADLTTTAMVNLGVLGLLLISLGSTTLDSLVKEDPCLPPRAKRLKTGKVYRLIELIPGAAIQGKGVVILEDMDHQRISYEISEEKEAELAKAKGELFLLRPNKDGQDRLSPFG